MISVVMATYNGSKYIIEQLNSILKQSLQPDEVIICDDCSSDDTALIIKAFIKENKLNNWFFEVNEKNKGYSLNFSDAMKKSKGDIIFLADQDDIWLEDKIKNMSQIIEKNPKIKLLVSNADPFYCGEAPQKVSFEKVYGKSELVKIKNKYKWIKPMRPGCSMCFRRELLKDYDYIWFDKYPHDCLLWGLAVLNDGAFLYNRSTINFRRHDSNASSRGGYSVNRRLGILENEITITEKMLNYYKSKADVNMPCDLSKQLDVYKKRMKLLKNKNIVLSLFMIRNIRYYGRARFWATDLFYCLK
ncbi:MAG: glycosyltransferase [Clostridiales bacterium]|nr:glycosyltransferase [Clostridiales bacterium]